MANMFDNSVLSTQNYDNTLIGWESKAVTDDIELGASGLTYCAGEAARQALIDDHNWTITGDALAAGCTSPEGEDQRIFVANDRNHNFSGSDFGVSNTSFSVIIESLPDEGNLEYDGDPVSVNDKVSVSDINDDMLIWDPPSNEYGYNFTSFEFTIADQNSNESEDSYTITIDLAATSVELTGGEGWRFLASPSNGETIGSFLEPIWTQGFPGSDSPGAPFVNVQLLDQENYQWDPAGHADDMMDVGQTAIVYVYSDDDKTGADEGFPKTLASTTSNWEPLNGSFGGPLLYDDLQDGVDDDNESFFLLGNPHPIGIDFCQTTRDNVADNIHVWDPSAGGGNGDYISLSCSLGDVQIAPYQGYWVRVASDDNEYVLSSESYMKSSAGGYLKQPHTNPSEGVFVSLTVSDETSRFTNKAHLLLSEDGTFGRDLTDAPKLSPAGLAQAYLSFYSLDEQGRPYFLQDLPQDAIASDQKLRIPLDIATTKAGEYTMQWTLPGPHVFSGRVYLRDHQSDEVMELQEGGSYRFEVAATHPSSDHSQGSGESMNWADPVQGDPRFELLIAASGVDGLSELGDVPTDFTLAQNYPNPFNPTTQISYQLPVDSRVRLAVFDMLGRQVATLVDEQMAAGRHSVTFDAGNLSSGIYLYRLQAGNTVMTRKLTIMK
jgi:hypothetical protein